MPVVRIKRSVTPGAAPTSLQEGELAINHADRKLFFRGPSGAVESIRIDEAIYALRHNPAFTGGVTVGNASNNGAIYIDGASESWRVLDFRHAGVLNWRIQARGDGDRHFQIVAFDNAGGWLRDVLTINRLTWAWTLNGSTTIVGDMGLLGTAWMRALVVQNGSNGYLNFVSGTSDRPGYVAWHTVDGVRRGYMGWKSADRDAINLNLENGWGLDINGADFAVRFNSIPFFRGNLGGSEGGEFWMARPLSGTSLAGEIAQDIQGNRIRWFEAGGAYRGFHLDFTTGTGGAGSAIWHDGNAPAYIRDASLRPRHAWDSAAFKTAVQSGADASNALEALLAQTGRLRLPDQGEKIKLTRRVSFGASGITLEGSRDGTIVELNAGNAGLDIVARHRCAISGLRMQAGPVVPGGSLPTTGYAISLGYSGSVNCYDTHIEKVLMDHVFNGVEVNGCTRTTLRDIDMLSLYGSAGVYMYGASSMNADLLMCENLIINTPAGGIFPSSMKGAWIGLTAYAVGDVVSHNGFFYQCIQAGNSGHPMLNPFEAQPTGSATSRNISDAGVIWRFLFRTALTGLWHGSWARTFDAKSCGVITLPYGYRMQDSLLVANSQPIWGYLTSCDFDHNIYNGVLLAHGQDCRMSQTYISSTKLSAGLSVASLYKGEGGFFNGVLRNNAFQGANISGPYEISDSELINNGQAAANTYDNIYVGPNVNDVSLVNNKFLPNVGATTQNARRPITVATGTADRLKIALNSSRGHGTSNSILNNSTGTGQIVVNNN